MKTILLVKTSSLGDVVHNLPVASDISAAIQGARIDWVVEEAFAAVPRLHPAVSRVLPVAIRRWRRSFLAGATRREIGAFLRDLRRQVYDAVIDTQGLLKSALVAFAARGTRHGLDWRSSREPLALFYDRTISVPWTAHAVERNRALAARALEYALPGVAEYGIRIDAGDSEWRTRGPYVVLLHATSQERKLWPERNWIDLGRLLAAGGRWCVLPWHGDEERARSERLAREIPEALVPARLGLAEAAQLIAGAAGVAGVDTGLTHLAGALRVPTVGIFCATDPAATGLYGCARALNLGGIDNPPSAREVIDGLLHLGG
jgi:lipopolysaccharide heptosyltransferase I